MTSNSESLFDLARCALKLAGQIKPLEERLAAFKQAFREHAEGDSLTVAVEGLGKVIVSKPTPPSLGEPELVLLREALEENSALKQQLIEMGVVAYQQKAKPGRVPAVEFRLNV